MNRTKQLDEILWELFTSRGFWGLSPRSRPAMYALNEALRRLQQVDPLWMDWRSCNARKEHECERGCTIRDGDLYFQYRTGAGWGDYLKLCMGCTAMVFYFNRTHELPRYTSSEWSLDKDDYDFDRFQDEE